MMPSASGLCALRTAMRLYTLGKIDVRSDAHDTAPVVAHAKRYGLLAYHATARPYALHRRDSLLALFWPNLGHTEARRALRQALHFLRAHLGEGIVLAKGDALSVPESLWCDARVFLKALDAEEYEEALRLYEGPFLDGYYLTDGSPQFEHWLDRERSYLRERAVDAAWKMSARVSATGNVEHAARWARRAAEIHATNEFSVQKLIAFLSSNGDRRGALRVFESFRQAMERDYQTQPAPETQALVRPLRDSSES